MAERPAVISILPGPLGRFRGTSVSVTLRLGHSDANLGADRLSQSPVAYALLSRGRAAEARPSMPWSDCRAQRRNRP